MKSASDGIYYFMEEMPPLFRHIDAKRHSFRSTGGKIMKKRSILILLLTLALVCLALPAQAEDSKCAFDKTVTTLF